MISPGREAPANRNTRADKWHDHLFFQTLKQLIEPLFIGNSPANTVLDDAVD